METAMGKRRTLYNGQKKAGRRWTWKSPKRCNEDRNLLHPNKRLDIGADVTVINQVTTDWI